MFSFSPYSDPSYVPQPPYPYPARPRAYGYSAAHPYTYSRALATEQAAREATAAAEQAAREAERRAAAAVQAAERGAAAAERAAERGAAAAERAAERGAAAAEQAAQEAERRAAAAEREAWSRSYSWNDGGDDNGYGYHNYVHGMSPRERAYAQAAQRQEAANTRRAQMIAAAEERRRVMEERIRRQHELRAAQSTWRAQQFNKQTARTPSPARAPSTPASKYTPSHPHPQTTPSSSTAPAPEKVDAATKIQTFYRTHKALDAVSQLESKFQDLKRAFVLPETLDFLSDDGSIITLRLDGSQTPARPQPGTSAGTARLAFTHTNIPIRAYDEALNRMLTQLDAVQSWGEKKVRERRKDVVRAVESEARRVEGIWGGVWERRFEETETERGEMGVDVEEENEDNTLVDEASVPPVIPDADAATEVEMDEDSSEARSQSDVASEIPPAAHDIEQESMSYAGDTATDEADAPSASVHLLATPADNVDEEAQMALDATPVSAASTELEPSVLELNSIPETLHDDSQTAVVSQSEFVRSSSPHNHDSTEISLVEPVSTVPSVEAIKSTLELNPTPSQQVPAVDTSEGVCAESPTVTPEIVSPNSQPESMRYDGDDNGDHDDDVDYMSFRSAASDGRSDSVEEEFGQDDEWDINDVGSDITSGDREPDDEDIDFVVL